MAPATLDADLMGDVMFGVLIFTPIIMVCIVNFVANPPLWMHQMRCSVCDGMCLRRLRPVEQRERAGCEQALAIA
ncbi:hypothetical protein EMVG_00110 [Emiliania huxleyi virus PS401]|jgi:hypothetical protein|nr:hypothetical protein EMVG_00110 [Emiliania huxleyi virus PS401]